jgi:predicted metal-dependent hydrolase
MDIELGGVEVRITRKAIKNIHLSVHPPDGKVTLACPVATPEDTIRLYLASKIGWVKRQQKLLQGKDRQSQRKYVTGETHYLFGRAYRLKVIQSVGNSNVQVKGKKRIELTVQSDMSEDAKQELMKEFYRAQLKKVLVKMIDDWSNKMNVSPEKWQVKAMKTKWGSCNTAKKSLLFNLELAKKPKSCIEYIVVHELVHLKERLHNDRFVYLMDMHIPKWREHKVELNKLPVSHAEWQY